MAEFVLPKREGRGASGETSDLHSPFSFRPPFHLFAVVMAAATFLLIIAGGLVTSTGSGLAVPDWPLSFGRFFPPMVGGVFYEHGHRLIAGTIGFLTLGMTAWVWRRPFSQTVRAVVSAALGTVILQALLGGLTVLLRLPPAVSIAHACLGQIFFCLMASLALVTSERWNHPAQAAPETLKLRRLGAMTIGFIFLQLILGATLRHTGSLLHVHMLGAALVAVHVILFARRLLSESLPLAEGQMAGIALLVLLGVQLYLGIMAWRQLSVVVATAHVATGALLLASTVVTTTLCYRRLTPL